MKNKADVMKDLSHVRRRTVIIQKKIDTFDAIGNPVEVWSNWQSLKAEKTELYGKEYYAAATVGQEETSVFTVRYVAFLDALNTVEYRIVYDGKHYDIKHIDHLPGETWMKIKAMERPGDSPGIRLVDHDLVKALVSLAEELIAELDEEEQEAYGNALAEILEGW